MTNAQIRKLIDLQINALGSLLQLNKELKKTYAELVKANQMAQAGIKKSEVV